MTTIPSTREERRDERLAKVLALIPNAAYEPKGVTAYTIHRRTGLGLQAIAGALQRLVKAGRVKRIRMGRDNGARYVIEAPADALDESRPLTPVELYRLEKQKRRDRAREAGITLPGDVSPALLDCAREMLANDAALRRPQGGRHEKKGRQETPIEQNAAAHEERISRSQAQPAAHSGKNAAQKGKNARAQTGDRHSVKQST